MSLSRRSFLQSVSAAFIAVPAVASVVHFDDLPQGMEASRDRSVGALCSNHKLRHMVYRYCKKQNIKEGFVQRYYRQFRWYMNSRDPRCVEAWQHQVRKGWCLPDKEAQLRLMWEMDKKLGFC